MFTIGSLYTFVLMLEEAKVSVSTEDKIRIAARKLFMKNGYDAVKTRDIAAEAGINIALLNYYFRSKEKLFEEIMLEKTQAFMNGLIQVANNPDTSLDQKIDQMVAYYLTLLMKQPDLPVFILSHIRTHSGLHFIHEKGPKIFKNSVLLKQIQEGMDAGKIKPINPMHIIANLLSLTVFPVAAQPMLSKVWNISDKQYMTFIEERKSLIPIWLKSLIYTNKR